MVIGVTAAGGAAAGSWLWAYNRENYKFDREMRQKNEFKILEFRKAQSQLWREDIRDIISLTEKKMDAYLIISVLQLDACLGLFTEGRLEPGTPPWLLQFYMLSLAAAFMFLLMSAWFSMHASVVAQCSSVRLLTQFVRLPVPSWNQLEDMRTYASSYEGIHPAHWFRAPFTRSMAPRDTVPQPDADASTDARTWPARGAGSAKDEQSAASADVHADPWGLEKHGEQRDIYELAEQDPAFRRHVLLARRAAARYQCFDAFARVSMTFGTNQFLCAIGYYSLGYVAVQDGAPWVAWAVVMIMGSIAVSMVVIDFSLTRCEQFQLQALIVMSLGTASACTFLFQADGMPQHRLFNSLLPVVYFANALWMFCALRACAITEQANGALLPMKFRAVLYLDVFGWLVKNEKGGYVDQRPAPRPGRCEMTPQVCQTVGESLPTPAAATGTSGPSGQIHAAPDHVWEPSTYCPHEEDADEAVVTGHDKLQPGRMAAHVFRSAAWLLILLWVAGACLPLDGFRDKLENPLVAEVMVQDAEQDHELESGMRVTIGEDVGGLPELLPVVNDYRTLPRLLGDLGLVQVTWPAHSTFVPHAISSSVDGREIMVADDFNVYYGRMRQEYVQHPAPASSGRTAALRGVPASLPTAKEGGSPVNSIANAVGDAVSAAWHAVDRRSRSMSPPPGPFGRRLQIPPYSAGVSPPVEAIVASAASTTEEEVGQDSDERSDLSLSFTQSGGCPALDGQAIKDISMFCGSTTDVDDCRLIALTGKGLTVHECALTPVTSEKSVVAATADLSRFGRTWTVSQDWLHTSTKEAVVSIAVNDDCVAHGAGNTSTPSRHDGVPQVSRFEPRQGGCLIVGTTSGRLVQMRESLSDSSVLVPERVMHQRPHPSARGALTFVGGRYVVALWSNFNSISAFDAFEGSLVKEWRLPVHVKWFMLARGGPFLYLLGVQKGGDVKLFNVPLPVELGGADGARTTGAATVP